MGDEIGSFAKGSNDAWVRALCSGLLPHEFVLMLRVRGSLTPDIFS